jgi:hypothetical protein
MRKWRCIRNCQFPGQHRRRAGHVYEFEDDVVPPHHFEPVEPAVQAPRKPEPLYSDESQGALEPNMRMRRDELVALANARGFDVTEAMTKHDIFALLKGGE